MRRFLLASAGLAVAAVLMVPVSASGQAPVRDSVVGEQNDIALGYFFGIDASSGPAGENPTGSFSVHFGGGGPTYSFEVSCLSVSGNSAIIGGTGTLFGMGSEFPIAGLISVVDAGGPGSRLDSFTWAVEVGKPPEPLPGPTTCSAFPGPFPVFGPLEVTGDIIVTDAQPFPTTKNQCKNGGWRNFPGFKNQGQCVAFVERGPRP